MSSHPVVIVKQYMGNVYSHCMAFNDGYEATHQVETWSDEEVQVVGRIVVCVPAENGQYLVGVVGGDYMHGKDSAVPGKFVETVAVMHKVTKQYGVNPKLVKW